MNTAAARALLALLAALTLLLTPLSPPALIPAAIVAAGAWAALAALVDGQRAHRRDRAIRMYRSALTAALAVA